MLRISTIRRWSVLALLLIPFFTVNAQIEVLVPSQDELLESQEFWTQERMLKTVPMDLPMVTEEEMAELYGESSPMPLGGAVTISAWQPGEEMEALAEEVFAQERAMAIELIKQEAALLGFVPNGDFTRFAINYFTNTWTNYPHRVMARLFFKLPSGANSSCSCSVVGLRAVVTAGHCVYTPGQGWHSNFYVVPAYRYGAAPWGGFGYISAATLSTWAFNADYRDDVGMIKTAKGGGYDIAQWVGAMGVMWNAAASQNLFAFGYPGNVGGGNYSSACTSQSFYSSNHIIGMGCDMTFGSSGGPWTVNYFPNTAGPVNYVNSVVSHGTPTIPKFYGPYFDSNNILLLWNWANL